MKSKITLQQLTTGTKKGTVEPVPFPSDLMPDDAADPAPFLDPIPGQESNDFNTPPWEPEDGDDDDAGEQLDLDLDYYDDPTDFSDLDGDLDDGPAW